MMHRFTLNKFSSASLRTVSLVLASVMIVLLLFGCAKSGSSYERKIKEELTERYDITFQVVDSLGSNSGGYDILVMAPEYDPDSTFAVQRKSGSRADGGLPYRNVLSEDYADTRYYYYYPALVEKHFGIQLEIPISLYWDKVQREELSLFMAMMMEHPEFYIDITLADLDETIRNSSSFFEEAAQHGMTRLYVAFQDPRFPIRDNASRRDYLFEINGAEKLVHHSDASGILFDEAQLQQQVMTKIKEVVSRDFGRAFNELYPIHKQAHIWSITSQWSDTLDDYTVQLAIVDTTLEELAEVLYGEYGKVMDFSRHIPDSKLTSIEFHVNQPGAQDLVYRLHPVIEDEGTLELDVFFDRLTVRSIGSPKKIIALHG